jgi:hypothetical protein
MPMLKVILILVVVGVIMWLINTYLPMDATIKKILNIVVVVCIVLWLLLDVFGLYAYLSSVRVPSYHHR